MQVKAIRTALVHPSDNLYQLLAESITNLAEGSVVAVTSKIVSLCENNVVKTSDISKEALIKAESELFLPKETSKYKHKFTITDSTLVGAAGIDESNSGGYYVLWPKNAQASANNIRRYLSKNYNVDHVGVIITDSTSQPLRRGSYGITLAHSGFKALNDYIGKPDLFDRPFTTSQANIASGLAASAVLAMGEGSERTPLAIISDSPLVEFQARDPSKRELDDLYPTLENDLFAPIIQAAPWRKGQNHQR